jgi:hypothetical protein
MRNSLERASASPSAKARRLCVALTTAVLLAAAAATAGCTQDLGALDFDGRGRPASGPSSSSRPSRRVEATPADVVDCDDLPALTPSELAGPPYDFDLQKPSSSDPNAPPPRYTVLSGVTLSHAAAAAIERLDEAYFKKTGERLVVTSGTRDAARQAKAMYKMIKLGADIVRLYKNKEAAREIKEAYDKASGKPPEAVIEAMYGALKDQQRRGVYISSHLKAGAVDIRSRTMSAADKRAFERSVAEVGGMRALEESKPPHYHLELE